VTVLSVVVGADPEVLKVGLSDGSSFFIRVSYLPDPSSAPRSGFELDEDAERVLRAAGDAYLAERAALRLVAGREHTLRALALKLRQRGFSDDALHLPLERLQAAGLVSDLRFAELWLASRIARKAEGRSALSAGLRARGVSRETAEQALSAVLDEETEASLVRRFLSERADASSADSAGDRAARRLLRSAGFSSAAIRAVLDG
jgi:regulatory protein